jgi:hypothetical protein
VADRPEEFWVAAPALAEDKAKPGFEETWGRLCVKGE